MACIIFSPEMSVIKNPLHYATISKMDLNITLIDALLLPKCQARRKFRIRITDDSLPASAYYCDDIITRPTPFLCIYFPLV